MGRISTLKKCAHDDFKRLHRLSDSCVSILNSVCWGGVRLYMISSILPTWLWQELLLRNPILRASPLVHWSPGDHLFGLNIFSSLIAFAMFVKSPSLCRRNKSFSMAVSAISKSMVLRMVIPDRRQAIFACAALS